MDMNIKIILLKKIRLVFIFLLLILFFSFQKLWAQNNTQADYILENLAESIMNETADEEEFSSVLDHFTDLYENPFNINTITREQLNELFFLSETEMDYIYDYVRNNKPIKSIYELGLIDELSRDKLKYMVLFFRVQKVESVNWNTKYMLKYANQNLFLRFQTDLEDSKAYLPENKGVYSGNKHKYYTRYQFKFKDKLSAGFTAEKDPGEAFFKENNKTGFDYYSMHFYAKPGGKLKALALGDYQLKFGQGLVLWSGMKSGKSVFTTNIMNKERGVQKYSSTDENKFMRGAAATFKIKKIEITTFLSYKKIDANFSYTDTLEKEPYVSTVLITGYHRTVSEIENKDAIGELSYGSNITYRGKTFRAGLTFLNYKISSAVAEKNEPYNLYRFTGNTNFNVGINYVYNYKKYTQFGEAAMSANGATAWLNGFLLSAAPGVSIAVLQRKYASAYHSSYANGFSEASTLGNENGFYAGVELHPVKNLKLSAYFDFFKFPWLRYRLNKPSEGNEYFMQSDLYISEKFSVYLRYKNERKFLNESDENEILRSVLNIQKQQLRLHFEHKINENITLRNRIEYACYKKEMTENKYGFLVYQDVNFNFNKIPLKINLRFAIFDTDNYDSRIYAYENDVLYGYSIPAYYNNGIRSYLNIHYNLGKNTDIWFRIAQSNYSGIENIGTGNDLISGNKRTQVKLQLRLKI